jgi:hypothetical protein
VSLVATHKNKNFELECFVAMAGESAAAAFAGQQSTKDVADAVAQLIWNESGYRFV